MAPWTAWWHRNFFAETQPWVAVVMGSDIGRWSVMLAGVLTLLGGVGEVRALLMRR